MKNPPLNTDNSGSVATIDVDKMSQNLEFLKQKAGVEGVIAVVKANAYGHGSVGVARNLEPSVEKFAVKSIDEAIQLREAGIQKPILVLGVPDVSTVEIYRKQALEATISDPDHFEILSESVDYQVNIDTGMRRIGIFPELVDTLIEKMEEYRKRNLTCRGIYSHYATADDPGSGFVMEQNERFRAIRNRFSPAIPLHMSNTAAAVHYSDLVDHFDLIRVGIGLSGYTPGKVQCLDLQPALEWTTKAVQVRRIRKGDAVSYTGSWKAPAAGYLATLPVGYADGVPRELSNRLKVKIGEKFYPIVGNITMDYCMVFTADDMISEGSTVHLMGENAWRANQWAEEAGAITHEIFCRLTGRIRREFRSKNTEFRNKKSEFRSKY